MNREESDATAGSGDAPRSRRVLARFELPIAAEGDIVVVRRKVKSMAQSAGFDAFATAAVTTAASELGRNTWVHGRGGLAVVEELFDGTRRGIGMEFRDHGPGIADVAWALAGGHSTARSLGLGLSGSRRLVDEFAIETAVGRGTTVRVAKWKRFG